MAIQPKKVYLLMVVMIQRILLLLVNFLTCYQNFQIKILDLVNADFQCLLKLKIITKMEQLEFVCGED